MSIWLYEVGQSQILTTLTKSIATQSWEINSPKYTIWKLSNLHFLKVQEQYVLGQNLKDSMDHLAIVFWGLSKDEDIIQVDYHNLFCYKVLKYIIHHSLEHNRTISYIKE